jgi:glycosyltransferase involved in cell wall biosynthesis
MTTPDKLGRESQPANDQTEVQPPMVSVIIPFWNTAPFLKQAIESVIEQSYDNWELLLVDDGSTDGSSDIARHFAEEYVGKVKVLTHEGRRNCGVSAARNLGLSHATGKHVCFLDADDVFLPRKLERELAILQAHPEAVVVCGAYQYWYSWTGATADLHRDFTVTLGVKADRLYQPPQLLVHNLRAGGRKPGTSGIMFDRQSLFVNACDESFVGLGDDQVFWAKLSLQVPVFVTNEPVFKYRQHPDSLCAVAMKVGDDSIAWQRYLNWLEQYLTSEKISDPDIWKALRSCQRSIGYQIKFGKVKMLYRRILPLRTRYWFRNRWIDLQSLRNR